jgi:hypothetical protein
VTPGPWKSAASDLHSGLDQVNAVTLLRAGVPALWCRPSGLILTTVGQEWSVRSGTERRVRNRALGRGSSGLVWTELLSSRPSGGEKALGQDEQRRDVRFRVFSIPGHQQLQARLNATATLNGRGNRHASDIVSKSNEYQWST